MEENRKIIILIDKSIQYRKKRSNHKVMSVFYN